MTTYLVPTLRSLISPRSGPVAGAIGLMLAASLAQAADVTVAVSGSTGSRSSASTLTTSSQISYTPVFDAFTASGAAVLLAAAIVDDVVTSITLDSTAGLAIGDIIQVGTEKMRVVTIPSGTTLTVTRGVLGTTAAAAADNAPVSLGGVNRLNGVVNDSVTTLTVDSSANIAVGDTLQIQSELFLVTAVPSGTTLTVVRGSYSSTATAHLDNAVVKLLSPGKATFDVVFSEAVYPSYLDNSGGRVSTTLLSSVFDGFIVEESDTTNGSGAYTAVTTWLAEQVDGRTFKVYVTSINANRFARLTVDPTKFHKSATGVAYGAGSTSGKVEFIENTVLSDIQVVQQSYFGFLNAPTVIGDFTVPAVDATVNVYVDGNIGVVTPVKVDAIGAGADWTYAPASAVAIGRHTYIFEGKDTAGTTAGGTTQSRVYYVWNAPTLDKVQQQTSGSPVAVASSGTVTLNTAKPQLEGLVGLPDGADAAMPGDAIPEVKVDIYQAGTLTPVVTQMTADIVAGAAGQSARWKIDDDGGDSEWGSNALPLTDNAEYDVVLTMRVRDSDGGATTAPDTVANVSSLNTQQSTRTLKIETTTGLTLALSLNGGGASTHLQYPVFSIDFSGAGGSTALKLFRVDTADVEIAGTIANVDSNTWTFTATDDIADGTHQFYVKWTDSAGNDNYVSPNFTLTLTTPSPTIVLRDSDNDGVLAGTQVSNHFPTFTIAGTNVTPTTGSITVKNGGTTIAGTITTVGADKVFTPTSQLPDGNYSLTAIYTVGADDSDESASPAVFSIITPTPKVEKPVVVTGESIVTAADGYTHYLQSSVVPRFKVTNAKDGSTALGSAGTLKVYRLDFTGTPLATAPTAATIIGTGTLTAGTLSGSIWTPNSGLLTDKSSYYFAAVWEDNNPSHGTDDDGADDIEGNADDQAKVTSVNSNVYALRVVNDVEMLDVPGLTFARPLGTGGSATAVLSSGTIGSIVLANAGSGYTSAPTVTLVGGGSPSTPAVVTATVSGGAITGFTISNAGAGYTAPPTIVLTPSYTSLTRTVNTVNTQSSEVKVTGTCNRGATIKAYRNGTLVGTKALAADATTWDFYFLSVGGDGTVLANGANQLTFTQTDLCGVTSAVTSPSVNVFVDGQTPNPPVITEPLTSTTGLLRPVFKGTAQANTTITLAFDTLDNTPADGALTSATTVTTDSAGKWTFTPNMDLTAGNVYAITAVATSSSGLVSAASTAVTLTVDVPALTVTLAPLAKGTAGSTYEINDDTAGYAKGATTIKIKTGTGTILVGDKITINTSPVTTATVTNVLGTTAAPTQVTITPGLAAAIAVAGGSDPYNLTVEDQPAGPAAGGSATSLAAIKLTATFTEADETHAITGGNDDDDTDGSVTTGTELPDAVANIVAADFVAADFTIAGGVIQSLVKGSGAVGAQPTNVWTLTVAPSTSGTLSVGLDSGKVKTAAGKFVKDFTIGTGVTATAQARVASDGTIAGLNLLLPGNGYTAAPTVTISGGGGASATATATVVGGRVTGFAITAAGSGYTSVPTVTIAAPTGIGSGYTQAPTVSIAGSGGTAASATAVVSNGVLTDVTVTGKGWGFTAAPTITLTPGGTGGVGTAVLSGNTVGSITTAGSGTGTGYTANPAVIITSGYGATATATVSAGKVTAIAVTTGGENFTQAPTVSFFGGGGTGAAATANISGGKVVSFTITNQGSGYTSAPAVFVTPTGTGATATATVSGGKVTAFTVTAAGSGYTVAPKVLVLSGTAASATPVMQDYTVLYNTAATTYTKPINRVKPAITWQYPADSLLPSAAPGTNLVAGTTYYGSVGAAAKVRLNWSSTMNRDLLATDLLVSTGTTATITEVGAAPDNKVYDITLTPASNAIATMTVSVKAAVSTAPGGLLSDNAVPAQTNLASIGATVKLVAAPTTGPVITSTVGAIAPAQAAKTPSYPCTITWPTPVSDFDATDLTVLNGVVTKFTGSGSVYTFQVTPGEGLVSVQFDHTKATVKSVTGAAYTASSNLLTRLLDSTQPKVVTVASPAFKLGTGASATATRTTTTVTGIANLDGGSGYEVAPDVLITSGYGATATATVSGGLVTALTITNAGEYYTTAPTVSFSGGGGSGAVATATIASGKVTGFTISNAGTGYTSAPTVTLTSVGSGATAVATVTAGVITGINVTAAGTGYTADPNVVIRHALKATDNTGVTRRIPVQVTFSEAPKAFPATAVVASAFGKDLVLLSPSGTTAGPQPVEGTGSRTWQFLLEVPVNMVGDLRLVVPSQAVQDIAANPSAASGVYDVAIDLINGTPLNVATQTYSDG
jgi:hypothetical protein